MKGKFLIFTLMLLAVLMIGSSASWGAIGVYKWTAGANVPSTISYMLNMDADDTSGPWSVQIAIVPTAGGDPVKTFSYLSPDPMTKRGSHSVVWDGSADAGGQAPIGKYKAVITAKGAPVTGTNLKGIFTNAPSQYMAVAVNNNVNSPWYGYIYLCVYHMGIAIVPPDGSSYTVKNFGNSWDGSSPWGIAIDANDNVWVSSRSGTANQWAKKVVAFKPDLSGRANIGPFTYPDNDRYVDVLGPTNNIYIADVTGRTSTTPYYGRIDTFHGDATAVTTATAMTDFILGVTTGTPDPAGWALQGVSLWDPQDGSAPVLFAASRVGTSNATGALLKYTIDWATGAPTLVFANTAVATTNPLCVTVSPDGTKLAFTKQTTTDGAQFWTVPMDKAATATVADCTQYGFTAPPDYQTGTAVTGYTYTHSMVYIRYDSLGNIVGSFSHGNYETQGGYWGFFAPPDNGSINSRTTGEISWSHPQPVIAGTNGPVAVASCATGATASASVSVTCADGFDKVASVKIDFSSLNKPGQGVVTLAGSGGIYTASFGVGDGLRVGDYNCPITVTSTWPDVPATTGNLVVRVTGATITGKVTNSKTGWPVSGATVTATTGNPPDFTATTDANGSYTLSVTPGSYAVSVSSPKYGATAGGADSFTLKCGDTKTDDLQLDPMDINKATGGNYYYGFGRAPNSIVCIVGSVMRAPQQGTDQGLNGYYYLYDTVTNNAISAVRVQNYAGQPAFKEGDLVVVEGNWDAPTGIMQGRLTPTRVPQIVGTGVKAQPAEFFASYLANKDHAYGGLYHVYGKVSDPQSAGVSPFGPYFKIEAPSDPANPAAAPTVIMVRVDTPATTGVVFPTAGQMVNVNGILSNMDIWQGDVLTVAKADDVYLISDSAKSVGDARNLADGSKVGMTKAQATVVGDGFVYVESPDRTAGLRLEGTLPASGLGVVGTGDLVDFHGTIAANAQGEKVVTTDLLQRSTQDHGASLRPLDAVGMSSRAANDAKALGMFVKTWGKVTAVNSDNFIISDGGYPVKVKCGAVMEKPSVDQTVRVRGVVSRDVDGLVLYMRNERADWTTGDANFQPLPFPGAFGYPRDFLVLGPFKDDNSADESYRLSHDFIADASKGAYTELSIADSNPKLGGSLGDYTWKRSQAQGDNVVFNAVNPAPPELTNVVFYAHIWVYSPVAQDVAMRIGSDDSAKVIVSNPAVVSAWGSPIEVYVTDPVIGRGETWGQDFAAYVPLDAGWNSVLIKVENGGGPSGADIQFVDPMTGIAAGYGNATPIAGLGYLLEKPAP